MEYVSVLIVLVYNLVNHEYWIGFCQSSHVKCMNNHVVKMHKGE
jgi:hypothetical protein